MSPFGIETIPAEALKALRTLPLLAERLDEVAGHTSVLSAITDDVSRIAGDVAPLPALHERVGTIGGNTGVLPAMDGRIATIEEAMPVLVEVQRHLAELPDTMEKLNAGITGLTDLLDRLVTSLGTLDENVASLQESMEPVGRLADKLPGGGGRRG